jgi:hypothetical protein
MQGEVGASWLELEAGQDGLGRSGRWLYSEMGA